MNIIAIGGGSIGMGVTESIDRELIQLTSEDRPRALFIPTASGDELGYCREFSTTYKRYGCDVEILKLHEGDDPSKITVADLIYVGGGNTKMMLEVWRQHGVDELLQEHVMAGKPAGGLSAGALCWFRVGNSDWPRYEGIPGVNTARLDCLGFVDLVLCPHTRNEEFRLDEFRQMMQEEHGVGVGLDDGCAIQVKDDHYRILSSMDGSVAHRIQWIEGTLHEVTLEAHDDFRPIQLLLSASLSK